jgi:serine O-acetyltransferase
MLRSTLSHLAVVGEDLAQARASGCEQCNESLWLQLRREAEEAVVQEPMLASLFFESIINQPTFEEAVFHRVGTRLKNDTVPLCLLTTIFRRAVSLEPAIGAAMRADIAAVMERDPACSRYLEPFLYFKGFHAIQTHRMAHWLWETGHRDFALYLQSRSSDVFQTDIHPAARFGRGIFLDHATGLVVGATAVVDDDVSILQNVTLGGTGKETGDRHPKIRRGVMIGAGAKILGNIEVGECSRIAAGSVVLRPVPANATVAGVPARQVGFVVSGEPSQTMDQILNTLAWDVSNYEI